MNHGVAGHKLGRNTAQRKALFRGLITELFRYDRISTTQAKALSIRSEAEHLITVAKRGLAADGNSVHAHRLAAAVITDPEVTKRLFNHIAPRLAERPGGYTRILKLGPRLGDGAEMVVLELVEKGDRAAEAEADKPKTAEVKPRRTLFGRRDSAEKKAAAPKRGKASR